MARYFRRRKFCRFTAEGVKEIDYKDLDVLREYVNETGTIVPSRRRQLEFHDDDEELAERIEEAHVETEEARS